MNTINQTTSSKSRKGMVALGIAAAAVALAGAVAIGVGSASADQSPVQPAVADSGVAAAVSTDVAATCTGYVDADGDGVCDWRGTRGAGAAAGAGCWTDADGDGVCDNCRSATCGGGHHGYGNGPADGTGYGYGAGNGGGHHGSHHGMGRAA